MNGLVFVLAVVAVLVEFQVSCSPPDKQETLVKKAESRAGPFGGSMEHGHVGGPPRQVALRPGLAPLEFPEPGGVRDAGSEPWGLASADTPQIKGINVQCEKNHMRVNVQFDKPFYGMVFSKGHYSDPNCVHMQPGTGTLEVNFDIFLSSCGMTSSGNFDEFGQPSVQGSYVENTVIVQYDPLVQEVWDQARRLRCTWYDFYEKSVTFRPFHVDSLSAVTANFLGDNLQCWMQIQVGKGPWAQEVSGIVKIGQTMTMVLAIKDDEGKFDMLVRNCVAHDGKRAPIQLVDGQGCVTRPKIMSRFQKIKNFGPSATVTSFALFQAFKFPDAMSVHFQCVIQVCRFQCPEPQCPGDPPFVGEESNQVHASLDPRSPSSSNHIDDGEVPPAPIPVGYHGPFPSEFPNVHAAANRGKEDAIAAESDTNLALAGGRPRAVDVSQNNEVQRRRRRDLRVYRRSATEMADIETSRTIQVVAPGDVAFNLNSANDTIVVSSASAELDGSSVCLSLPGFVAGIVMLLLVLVVASLVAGFMVIRMKGFSTQKSHLPNFARQSFDILPEFVKAP